MKKWLLACLLVILGLTTVACSSDQSTESADMSKDSASGEMNRDMANEMEMATEQSTIESESVEQNVDEETTSEDIPDQTNRKIIYNADLQVEVKDYNQAVSDIQSQINEKGGYVVESRTYGGSKEDLQEGMITARIPQEQFQSFIDVVEQGSMKVIEKSISGEDVTEQYVDLESRLKSKKIVEERLLSFMEQAEKTEDLLEISNDLAKVQEEIEQITGKMNYLQNRADLATVSIHIYENKVNIPNVNEDELNTWEKTKQQFMESINFLLSAISGLVVFFIGNLPILLILIVVGLITFQIIKKRKKREE